MEAMDAIEGTMRAQQNLLTELTWATSQMVCYLMEGGILTPEEYAKAKAAARAVREAVKDAIDDGGPNRIVKEAVR
jgi:hypothetical protein